jgi:hypothetical protein
VGERHWRAVSVCQFAESNIEELESVARSSVDVTEDYQRQHRLNVVAAV